MVFILTLLLFRKEGPVFMKHCLVPTIERFDDSRETLLELVCDPYDDYEYLTTYAFLKKMAESGPENASHAAALGERLATSCLAVDNDSLRLANFKALCLLPGASVSTLPSVEEVKAMGSFLRNNVHVSDVGFRLEVSKSVLKLFGRIRCAMEKATCVEGAS
jgi:hypothetical protein